MGTFAWPVAGSLFGGFVAAALATVAWRHRGEPAAVPFGALMAALGVWGFSQAALLSTRSLAAGYALDVVAAVTSAQVPPLLLVFVLAYAGRDRWLRPRYLAALWSVPAGFAIVRATAALHGLASVPADATLVTVRGTTAPYVPTGPISDAELVYGYVMIALAYAVLLRFAMTARVVHRRQTAAIAVAATVGLGADVATRFGLHVHPEASLTPLSIPVVGVAIGWALFRYDFLRVSPLAGDLLVDQLPDPVLVVDEGDRIVDHNRTARERFGPDIRGDPLDATAPGLCDALNGDEAYTDRGDGGITYYDPQVTAIEDQHGDQRGRLVVLRDVTGQQRRQDRLEALQSATREFITAESEREIAQLAVSFADRVLDGDAAAVYLAEGDELRPAAVSERLEREYDAAELVVDDPSDPVVRAYETGTATTERRAGDAAAGRQRLAVPLEGHGALTVERGEGAAFPAEDEQFAEILARTTQVALTQIERERELRESRATVERRSEQLEFFNGVLRHTLRNALLVIRGRAEHLREDVDGESAAHLDRIVGWCDDLTELSEKIRAINDTVTASEAERLETIALSDRLRDRAEQVSAARGGVTVDCDVDDGLRVLANELVDDVIDSVVRNAVRHNDADSPRVEIRGRRIADRVRIEVTDNGPGMTDEMKETVFDRDVATSQTAHGFGLYFVSVMMNLYGGTVWFEDNEPRGTVAVMEFRCADRIEAKGTSEPA
ncbi:histidine kinase N-terminal 7TM domain-containing protein [Halomicrobium salinisoli]|uniref:sensor histidine kinase n=1 Tax=Halomicrobium salinisoli TaxID=2878391 RepID=UPI001CF081E0|nr:histidine kinase N-terminal 7TM domain-containing protein [Halomicrobium salinisoli]